MKSTSRIAGIKATVLGLMLIFLLSHCSKNDQPIAPIQQPQVPTTPMPPSDLQAQRESDTQVRLNWSDNSDDELGFIVNRIRTDKSPFDEQVTWDTLGGNITSYADTDADQQFSYSYTVYSYNEAGASQSSNSTTIAATVNQPKTVDLVITNLTFTVTPNSLEPGENVTVPQFTIRNNGDTSANAFEVGMYLSADAGITNTDRLLAKIQVNKLDAGIAQSFGPYNVSLPLDVAPSDYFVGVLADLANTVSETDETNNQVSGRFTVNAKLEAPDAPSDLSSEDLGGNRARLSWVDNSDNETGFQLVLKPFKGGPDTVVVLANVTSIEYQFPKAGNYIFDVRAMNPVGYSAFAGSAPIVLLPDEVVVNAPSNLIVTDEGNYIVNLSWTDNSDNESRFLVLVTFSQLGDFFSVDVRANSTSLTQQLPGPGNYSFQVRAVNDDANAYSDFSNLAQASIAPILPPKLPDLTWEGPASGTVVGSIRIGETLFLDAFTMKNAGDTFAVAQAGVYIGTESVSPADLISPTYFEGQITTGLQPGETHSLATTQFGFSSNHSADFIQIALVMDYKNEIQEISETNNVCRYVYTIDRSPIEPDLTVYSPNVNAMASEVKAGENLQLFEWAVKNIGADAGACLLRAYLSTDPQLTVADLALSDAEQLPALSTDQQWNINPHSVAIPKTVTPGTYYVGVLVDSDDRIPESDESNNFVVGAITVFPPDPPKQPFNLKAIDISYNEVTLLWIDNSDDEQFFVISRSRQSTMTNSTEFTVSANTTDVTLSLPSAGTWYFTVAARNQYGTSLPSNVVQVDAPQPAPDLIIDQPQFLVTPNTVQFGTEVTVTDFIVRNIGPVQSGTFEVWWYISSTSAYGPPGFVLKKGIVSGLNGGNAGVKFYIEKVTIPPLPPGKYYLGVFVDGKKQVAEMDETNNYKSFKVTVP